MSTRTYVSPVRTAAAQAKRLRAIEAAADFLRREPLSAFSLETVARAAGVTRLTLYNQFGSRRGLLEAAFDHLAQLGRLGRIADAVTSPDPRQGLDQLVEIFCDFWSSDPAVGRLHDAMATDSELEVALTARNARRRLGIAALIERMPLGAVDPARRQEAIDFIFALTSYPMFRLLAENRPPEAACALIRAACRDALARLSTNLDG